MTEPHSVAGTPEPAATPAPTGATGATATEGPALAAAFVERRLATAALELRYWEAGTGDPLVYLHPGGGPQWRLPLDRLAERRRVIQFEMPGFGAPPQPAVSSLAELATLMGRAIAALGLERYDLMGTSFGGAVAAHLASRSPDAIRSLVLESPAAFREGATPPDQLPPERFVRAFRTHPERFPPMETLGADWRTRIAPFVRRLLSATAVEESLAVQLAACPVRTLIVFGLDDGVIPAVNGRTYRRLLVNSSLQYVYDAAHDVQGDRPEAFTELVEDFLRRGMAFLVPDEDGLINP